MKLLISLLLASSFVMAKDIQLNVETKVVAKGLRSVNMFVAKKSAEKKLEKKIAKKKEACMDKGAELLVQETKVKAYKSGKDYWKGKATAIVVCKEMLD